MATILWGPKIVGCGRSRMRVWVEAGDPCPIAHISRISPWRFWYWLRRCQEYVTVPGDAFDLGLSMVENLERKGQP